MSDSFFTSRNTVDPQIETASVQFCSDLIDAATRRIANLEGPLGAAVRVQRISDICSGAHVLPIEHWSKLEAPKPTEPPKSPATRRQRFLDFIGNPMMAWLAGLAAGYLMGSS